MILLALPESAILFSDNATGDVSAAKHGFAPKLPSINDSKQYVLVNGVWAELSELDSVYVAQCGITLSPSGFADRTKSTISFTDTGPDRTFAIAPTGSSFDVYSQGVKYTKATVTKQIANTTGLHYLYFDTAGVLQESVDPWTIASAAIPVAIVYWNGTTHRLCDERHSAGRWPMLHENLHETRGAAYASGGAITAATDGATFTVAHGHWYDEDYGHQPAEQTTAPIFYRAGGVWTWTTAGAKIYHSVSSVPQFDNAGTIGDVTGTKYSHTWVYWSNDTAAPVVLVMGQSSHNTQAQAEAIGPDSLTLPPQLGAESKLLYRLVWQRNGSAVTLKSTTDYRRATGSPTSYVASDHLALANLTWRTSGHIGTANKIAAFDADGNATEKTIGTDILAPTGDGSALTGISVPAQSIAGGRLTLESGVSVSTSDQAAKTTVYYTPHVHDQIGIYTGSVWTARTFAELSIALTKTTNGTTTSGLTNVSGISSTTQLVAGMEVTGTGIDSATTIFSVDSPTSIVLSKNATGSGTNSLTFKIPASKVVDIFATWTGSAVELVFGPLWTNTTTRATAIAQQNGVWTQTGTPTRRLVGTVATTATAGQTQVVFGGVNSAGSILIDNAQNWVAVCLSCADSTDSWTYTLTQWRQKNAAAVNQISVIVSVPGRAISLAAVDLGSNAAGNGINTAISQDSTSSPLAGCLFGFNAGATNQQLVAIASSKPAVGYHYFAQLESSTAASTTTWYGDAGAATIFQTGMRAVWNY